MLYPLLLLLFSYLLALIYQNKAVLVDNPSLKRCGWISEDISAKVIFTILVLLLILYSGLRSSYNDTASYIGGYLYGVQGNIESLKGLSFGFLDEPGYRIYQILIKIIFGNNYARFLTITALIINSSNIIFFRKYSSDFSLAVFIYIASTCYNFSNAAMRQFLAMAIGIWAIPLLFNKKWIKGIAILILAASFHKLIIVYAIAVFLKKDTWSWKTYLLILGTVICAIGFSTILPNFSEKLGYNEEYISFLASTQGTSIFRVLVWLIPTVFSFLLRKRVNEVSNPLQIVIINLSIVGSMIMLLASLGAANMIARMAFYFYPFFILSFSELITPNILGENCESLKCCCKIGFLFFFLILSWNSTGFFVDGLRHNSIFDLFRKELYK